MSNNSIENNFAPSQIQYIISNNERSITANCQICQSTIIWNSERYYQTCLENRSNQTENKTKEDTNENEIIGTNTYQR